MNGITFNGTHSSQIAGIKAVLDYNLPLMPSMRNKTVQLAGSHGAFDGGRVFDPRPFVIKFLASGATIEDYFEKTFGIEDWLNVNEPKPFIFDAMPDRQLMARPTSIIDPERFGRVSTFDVEFTAFNPFFEAIKATEGQINLNYQYEYTGTKPTPFVLNVTVNEALPFFMLSNFETGDFISIAEPIAAGDEIIIDTDSRIVRVNGLDKRNKMTIDSRFFKIDGATTFKSNAAAVTMDISYKERW